MATVEEGWLNPKAIPEPKSREPRITKEYSEGCAAFHAKKTLEDNPYNIKGTEDTVLVHKFHEWQDGWIFTMIDEKCKEKQ
jgi:hypothetical protein